MILTVLRAYTELMTRFSMIVEKLISESDIDSQEPEFTISDINGEHHVIDLRKEPSASVIYNEQCTTDDIRAFNK